MIGMMVGVPSAVVGFLVHLVISTLIGISFAVLFDRFLGSVSSGLASGLVYGGAWWFLGPLTLMPLMMGMGLNWNAAAASQMLPSLVGHLLYGAILGTSYAWLKSRGAECQTACLYKPRARSGRALNASGMIGVGRAHWFELPLPPNRTCRSPASGSPVSGVHSGTD